MPINTVLPRQNKTTMIHGKEGGTQLLAARVLHCRRNNSSVDWMGWELFVAG